MPLAYLPSHDDRWISCIRGRTALGLCLAFAAAIHAASASAQPNNSHTLVARSRTASIAVVGDSIANELGRGLQALFSNRRTIRVVKETQFATGLVRTDEYDWDGTMRRFLARHRPDVIVVNIGGNDRQPIRYGGRTLDRFTRAWYREYERRVSRFMNILKRSRAKVYWVGLPIVRSNRMTRDYWTMNRIYRRQAARHHFTYVSIWRTFAGSGGGYTPYGRSLRGKTRRLRNEDGMHFTADGRLRLAAHVARAMRLH